MPARRSVPPGTASSPGRPLARARPGDTRPAAAWRPLRRAPPAPGPCRCSSPRSSRSSRTSATYPPPVTSTRSSVAIPLSLRSPGPAGVRQAVEDPGLQLSGVVMPVAVHLPALAGDLPALARAPAADGLVGRAESEPAASFAGEPPPGSGPGRRRDRAQRLVHHLDVVVHGLMLPDAGHRPPSGCPAARSGVLLVGHAQQVFHFGVDLRHAAQRDL